MLFLLLAVLSLPAPSSAADVKGSYDLAPRVYKIADARAALGAKAVRRPLLQRPAFDVIYTMQGPGDVPRVPTPNDQMVVLLRPASYIIQNAQVDMKAGDFQVWKAGNWRGGLKRLTSTEHIIVSAHRGTKSPPPVGKSPHEAMYGFETSLRKGAAAGGVREREEKGGSAITPSAVEFTATTRQPAPSQHHLVYVVLGGSARVSAGGSSVLAQADTVVWIPAGAKDRVIEPQGGAFRVVQAKIVP